MEVSLEEQAVEAKAFLQGLVELFDRDGLSAQQALALPRSHTGRIAQLARELNGPTLHSNDETLRALLDDLDTSGGVKPLRRCARRRRSRRVRAW